MPHHKIPKTNKNLNNGLNQRLEMIIAVSVSLISVLAEIGKYIFGSFDKIIYLKSFVVLLYFDVKIGFFSLICAKI